MLSELADFLLQGEFLLRVLHLLCGGRVRSVARGHGYGGECLFAGCAGYGDGCAGYGDGR
jgi:hypothetical protein